VERVVRKRGLHIVDNGNVGIGHGENLSVFRDNRNVPVNDRAGGNEGDLLARSGSGLLPVFPSLARGRQSRDPN
jgi:hypothetical protein